MNEVISFWFPDNNFQDFWFDKSKDVIIKEKFNYLLKDVSIMNKWLNTKDGILAYIIVLDQFNRNINRGDHSTIQEYDKLALPIALKLLKNYEDLTYQPHQRIFILLPLRHQKSIEYLDQVMERLQLYDNNILFNRFRTATVKNYINLTSDIKIYDTKSNDTPRYNDYIVDVECKSYDSIENKTDITKEPLYKTLMEFSKNQTVGISLSGGVDSMVMCYILNRIKPTIAIHIKYSNRDESAAETNFIINWCKFYGIILIVREINYVKRSEIDRDVYEQVTKDIRFMLYKFAINKYNIDGVCLGHHRDDVSENVLMNIMKGNDIMNLSGTHKTGKIDGVNILRPLLGHVKQDIYDFANKYGIYYMKDTTPEWSCRGVLRNELMPILNKQFGNVNKNLSIIGKFSDNWNIVIEKMVFKPIFDSICYEENGFIVPINGEMLTMPDIFWTKVLQTSFYKIGSRDKISNSNIAQFIHWLQLGRDTKCTINKFFAAIKGNQLIVKRL